MKHPEIHRQSRGAGSPQARRWAISVTGAKAESAVDLAVAAALRSDGRVVPDQNLAGGGDDEGVGEPVHPGCGRGAVTISHDCS